MSTPSHSPSAPRAPGPSNPETGDARRDAFVALLAHEIRNPLAPIRSGVQLLQSPLVGDHVRAQTLQMMERQLSHLVRLVDDLLASVSARRGEAPASPHLHRPSHHTAVTPWRRLRVLVVDDNRDAAQTLGALLELDGHTIRLAHDGPSAVAEAAEFRPDTVLIDIGLPGFSGIVATQQIRRAQLTPRATIVALTGWGSPPDRAATQAAGCDLHLVKPIDYREIAQMLTLSQNDSKEAS